MWKMRSGDGILSPAEFDVFLEGINGITDGVEIHTDVTGVDFFDRNTEEQRLALLADIATALSDPETPSPPLVAVFEATVAAVLRMFWINLVESIDCEQPNLDYRRLLLAVFEDEDQVELPDVSEADLSEWSELYLNFKARILVGRFYSRADKLLDRHPSDTCAILRRRGLDRDYFVSIPRDPKGAELIAVRQALARFLGEPPINDSGVYSFLHDGFHDLEVGPCTNEEIAAWQGHPWMRIGVHRLPYTDLTYDQWRETFSRQVPSTALDLKSGVLAHDATWPPGFSVEQHGLRWVIRDQQRRVWSCVIGNEWADETFDVDSVLTFETEDEATYAYWQANQMYSQRILRQKAAFAQLGVIDLKVLSYELLFGRTKFERK